METFMIDKLKKKQQELKDWMDKLGLSHNVFAERVYIHLNEISIDDDIETKKFIFRFKQAINRDTTKIKLIESYLDILFEQDEFLKLGLVKPKFHYENEFSKEFNIKMKDISKKISEKITSQQDV